MAQVDKKAILAQIQKLLALGTSPNENEAKLATAKANALLLKYNLSCIHRLTLLMVALFFGICKISASNGIGEKGTLYGQVI